MKNILDYIKTKPLAYISLIFLLIIYFVMIFAEFIAPYKATTTFEQNTFHPANVELSIKGLKVREHRVIEKSTWRYAKVKDTEYIHNLSFFVKGSSYKLLGFIPCDRHLFGTKPSKDGTIYPAYLLGADNLGRDLFSRIVYGSRISLTIGFVATAISLFIAILLGGISGYFGGTTDWTIMRFAEFFMLIPSLYFILFLRSLLNTKMDSGTSYMVITLILSLVGWPGSARTIRGIVHSLKNEEFVINAKIEGIPSFIIIFKYIIPQITSLLIVNTALSVPGFIMSETTLSYLGLGINDPAVSWGSLINRDISTLSNLKNFPWLLIPVLLLLLVTLSFNFIGDALRDFYDPYSRVFSKKKKLLKTIQNIKNKTVDNVPFLQIKNLSVSFTILRGTKKITINSVRNISFTMQKGEILGLVGESGSGKSVSTTAIPGLLSENALCTGDIFFEGVNLRKLTQKQLREYRGSKIALVFQEPGRAFDPLQNIQNAFYETLKNSNQDITKQEAIVKTIQLLKEVGIPDPENRLKAYPHQFSGGQLQRICIALALAQDCQLLIADEITTALDVTIQAQIISLLMKLKQERKLSIIFISHDINLVAKIADRIAVMYGGKIMELNTSSKIMNNPDHPYTKALVSALPQFGSHYTKSKMNSIPGKVCDPSTIIEGCPFAPRCKFFKEICNTKNYNCCQ